LALQGAPDEQSSAHCVLRRKTYQVLKRAKVPANIRLLNKQTVVTKVGRLRQQTGQKGWNWFNWTPNRTSRAAPFAIHVAHGAFSSLSTSSFVISLSASAELFSLLAPAATMLPVTGDDTRRAVDIRTQAAIFTPCSTSLREI
jgi:hypothetical protein